MSIWAYGERTPRPKKSILIIKHFSNGADKTCNSPSPRSKQGDYFTKRIKLQIKNLDRRKIKIVLWSGFAILCGTYLGISLSPISESSKHLILVLAYLVIQTCAILGSLLAFRMAKGIERRFWFSLMSANLIMLAGVLWLCYGLVTHTPTPPRPSYADYAYLSVNVFFFLLLLSMTRFSNAFALNKLRYLLDIIVVMVLSSMVVWFFLIKPMFLQYPNITTAERVLNSIYPILDLGIIFGIFANLFGFKTSKWRAWEILTASALMLFALGDFALDRSPAVQTHPGVVFIFSSWGLSWLSAYFLFFIAAIYRITEQKSSPKQHSSSSFDRQNLKFPDIAVPILLLIAIPFLMYMAHVRRDVAIDYWVLVISATSLSILIVTRAGVVIAENNQLFLHSVTDFVTGLFNHRFFQDRIHSELERAQRYGENLSLAILDIDDFSQINDFFGHSLGDKALRLLGQTTRSCTRVSDTVCRTGGDEFGLIMPQANSIQAFQVCQRIREEIKKIEDIKNVELKVSIGIASFPVHAEEKDDLIKKADGALYWAKYHGKDQVFIFDADVVKLLDAEERAKRAEEQAYLNTVHALAEVVDTRDFYTRFHSRHVASLAVPLAQKLGLDRNKVKLLEMAALLHDIGKMGIPDKILKKKGVLTERERKQIQSHPVLSQRILAATSLKDILPWVISHHERWDGKGYPRGLKAEEIPLEARILGICDAYDAMTSDRPYRKALSREAALEELRKEAGKQFDPKLVEEFMQLLQQIEEAVAIAK